MTLLNAGRVSGFNGEVMETDCSDFPSLSKAVLLKRSSEWLSEKDHGLLSQAK